MFGDWRRFSYDQFRCPECNHILMQCDDYAVCLNCGLVLCKSVNKIYKQDTLELDPRNPSTDVVPRKE